MKKTIFTLVITLCAFLGFGQGFSLLNSTVSTTLGTVDFADDNNGFVVGVKGTLLKTTNSGKTWSKLRSPSLVDFTDIYLVDKDTAYLTGRAGSLYKTTTGGLSWTKKTLKISTDLSRVVAMGNIVIVSGYSGVILRSTDYGKTFNSVKSGSSTYLYGIHFTSKTTGFIVGHMGTLLKTTNAGASWTPVTSGTNEQLLDIDFSDRNTGHIIGGNIKGNSSVILRTTDGGKTWKKKVYSNTFMLTINFVTSSVGYAVGGDITKNSSTIMKTMDSGVTWNVVKTNFKRQVGSCFPSLNVGFTTGLEGQILKTQNILTDVKEVGETEKSNVVLYPNPTNGIVNIKTGPGVYPNIQVLNVVGSVVLEKENATQVDLTGFEKGIYIVKVSQGEQTTTKRIILQ